jgi:hypothetical protein
MTIFLDAITAFSFSLSLTFVIIYGIRYPWYNSAFGRALMLHVLSLTYLMVPLLLHHPFNVSTAKNETVTWIQTSALGTVSLTASYLLYVLLRAPHIIKHRPDC